MLRRLSLLAALLLAGPAAAQNPFSAAVTVNDQAVTYWEIEQRQRFLDLLNAPPDVIAEVPETLVNERLQIAAARAAGDLPTPEELQEALENFAGRANLTADAFTGQLEARGVAGETFRDFVYAGITWRAHVRARFGPRVQVTDAEIDRALALGETEGGAQVQLAEIVLPLTPQTETEARALIADLSRSTNGSIDAFAAAARRYSAAGSADAGGVLGYRPLSSLPPDLRNAVLALSPGGVTQPISLGQGIAIFQLRDLRETGFSGPEVTALDYAAVALPGGRSEATLSEARALRDALDTCDDLYGVLPGGFTREVTTTDQVPAEIATELAGLDDNEVSFDLVSQGGELLFLMLCGRATELPEGARAEIRQGLVAERLASYADGYLAELRADAIIREAE